MHWRQFERGDANRRRLAPRVPITRMRIAVAIVPENNGLGYWTVV